MLMSPVYLQQRNTEMSKNNKKEKEIKTVNVEEENFHIFRTTWETLMKFLGFFSLSLSLSLSRKQENIVLKYF